MPLLNEADAVYLGQDSADALYLGRNKVWPPAPAEPDLPGWRWPNDVEGWVTSVDHGLAEFWSQTAGTHGGNGVLYADLDDPSARLTFFDDTGYGTPDAAACSAAMTAAGLVEGKTYRVRIKWLLTGPPASGLGSGKLIQVYWSWGTSGIEGFKFLVRTGKGEAFPTGWQETISDPILYQPTWTDYRWLPVVYARKVSSGNNTLYMDAFEFIEEV